MLFIDAELYLKNPKLARFWIRHGREKFCNFYSLNCGQGMLTDNFRRLTVK